MVIVMSTIVTINIVITLMMLSFITYLPTLSQLTPHLDVCSTMIIVITMMLVITGIYLPMVLQVDVHTWMSALLLRSSAGRAWKAVQERLSCQATWQRMQNLWLQLWQALLTSLHRAGTLQLRGANIFRKPQHVWLPCRPV